MRKLLAVVRMLFCCTTIAVYLVVVGTPVLTYCRLKRDPRLAIYLTWVLDRIVLYLAGVDVITEGLDKVKPGQGYIYVGNHRSFIDILAAYLVLPGDLRFIAKKEIFKIPMLSFALRTMGVIEIDRSDHESATKSIARAAKELAAGRCIVLFPEGTRSRLPREMLPFKKGAFVLAIQTKAPLLPFTILSAEERLRPGTMQLYPGTVRLILHDPIETSGMAFDDRGELLERAREVIEKTYLESLKS